MTQPSEPEWSTELALSVAAEVRRHRQAQGLSAQQLADRCAELGMPIQRSVIANMESGRRTTVTVAEVLVLAAALQVPPALLLLSVGHSEKVEILPRQFVDPLDAADWFVGIGRGLGPSFSTRGKNSLHVYRRHRALSNQLRRLLEQREQSRTEYVQSQEGEQERRRRRDALNAQMAELQVIVFDHRAREQLAAPGERVVEPPEVAEATAAISELSREEAELGLPALTAKYLRIAIERLDESIEQAAYELAKVRRDIQEAGWVLPRLRDDLYGIVVDLPWQEKMPYPEGELDEVDGEA